MDIETARCSLTELVQDPLIALVMRSDGVERSELDLLLRRVARERLRSTEREVARLPMSGTAG
jgi:hypothetical protein